MDTAPYKNCQLCPRNCKVDRTQGRLGFCGESATCSISFIGPHFGEEPSFTGTHGSGTVFFSGCSSQCFFCQNHQISLGHDGRAVTPEELLSEVRALLKKDVERTVIPAKAGIQERGSPTEAFGDDKLRRSQEWGVHNLNFVTPDHFWPHVRNLCLALREENIPVPAIFNCSGYQKSEMIDEYSEYMDMFLPDFKFAEPELAQKCMGDRRYPEIAFAAIRSMVKAKGFLEPWDPSGRSPAKRGVLVRHLVLPGHAENSLKVLKLLHKEFGSGIPLSVMSQFRPVPECCKRHELERTVKAREYEEVLGFVEDLGFEKVYTQELKEDVSFLPDFKDPEGPFPGNRGLKNQP